MDLPWLKERLSFTVPNQDPLDDEEEQILAAFKRVLEKNRTLSNQLDRATRGSKRPRHDKEFPLSHTCPEGGAPTREMCDRDGRALPFYQEVEEEEPSGM